MIDQSTPPMFDSPYPGLRPFQPEETDRFFGRAEQLDEMLAKLEVNHFLAVVGTSGCGKSSLVRAGLLPAIEDGFLSEVGPFWRMVMMRPAAAPIAMLADELSKDSALGRERGTDANARAMLQATLRRGRMGLVNAFRETHLPEGTNFLLLVDQFEEIFRFRQQGGGIKQATAFVNLLLAAAQQRELPIYVVLTMRSDFLGDCAAFEQLPEAINESQFLTPRLTRDQLRDAIVGPARLFRCGIEPAVVNRILNDVGTRPDQLPLMQHCLMRVWWNVKDRIEEGDNGEKVRGTIGLTDYEATGGLERALSIHANEAYEELTPPQKQIAETLFRCITDISSIGRGTRRPVSLAEVAAVAGVQSADVAQVVEVFRQPGRSFLIPPVGVMLDADTVIDISHESLIRQWDKLVGVRADGAAAMDEATGWLHIEAESASIYRRLAQTAALWQKGQAGLWGTPDLELALDWRDREQPKPAWSERYGGGFESSIEFLEASADAHSERIRAEEEAHRKAEREKQKEQRQRLVVLGAILGVMLSLAIAVSAAYIAFWMNQLKDEASFEANIASREAKRADQEAAAASRSAFNAQLARFPDVWRNNPDQGQPLLYRTKTEYRDFTWRYYFGLTQQVREEVAPMIGALNALAFSADGRWLALAGADGRLAVYDVSQSPPVEQFTDPVEAHQGAVYCVAFSPQDGSETLASAGEDGIIRLWDVTTGQPKSPPLTGHTARIRSLAFSPNGLMLASAGDDQTVRLWNTQANQQTQMLGGHDGWVSCVTFSPDGETVASASYDTTVKLWNSRTGELRQTHALHTAAVYTVAFSPAGGGTMAAAGKDGTVALWKVSRQSDGNRRQTLEKLRAEAGAVYSVAFYQDGKTLASANEDGTTSLWDVGEDARAQFRQTFADHLGAVYSVAVSASGERLATAGSDGKAFIRQATTGQSQVTLLASTVLGLVFCRDGTLASTDGDGSIQFWDTATAQPIDVPNAPTANARLLAFNGATLASAGRDGVVLWNPDGLQQMRKLTADDDVTSLAFSVDGQTLATGWEGGAIQLWSVDTGRELLPAAFQGHRDKINSLAFDPEGTMLASGSADQTIRLWDVKSGQLSHRLPSSAVEEEGWDWVRSVAFSPDGKTLASADDDGVIRLWDLEQLGESGGATAAKRLEGHTGAVTWLAFAPDGETLASSSVDNTIMLWDPKVGEWRGTLRGHTGPVRVLAFRSDSRMLASASDDTTIRLWIGNDP